MSGEPTGPRPGQSPGQSPGQAIGRLAPGFLLAPPPLTDPNFDRTLVLLALHEAEGSMGFVVNRPSELHLHQLLKELEMEHSVDDRRVMIGGPVSGFSGFVLYEHAVKSPAGPGFEVSETISISPSRDILQSAARGQLPGRFDLLLGYAGWAATQLEQELERGAWLHAPFDPELLFDVPLSERWDETYKRLGLAPYAFQNVPGGAQA